MARFEWTEDQLNFIKTWWPHFGTEWCAQELQQTRLRVKSKIDKLKISMLPKSQRLCIHCKVEHQYVDKNPNRRTNKTCKKCELEHRKLTRDRSPETLKRAAKVSYDKRRQDKTWEELFSETARTLRYRNKKLHNCSYLITAKELHDLFEKQHGKCFYSGRMMEKPITNDGLKNMNVMSVDRIDSLGGYTPDNIVLCTFAANVAKLNWCLDDFVKFCNDVAQTHNRYLS